VTIKNNKNEHMKETLTIVETVVAKSNLSTSERLKNIRDSGKKLDISKFGFEFTRKIFKGKDINFTNELLNERNS
jgi:hypothetical protein